MLRVAVSGLTSFLLYTPFAVLRVGGCDGGGARLRGRRVRNRGCQRDHQGGAAARPPHRPTPALSRRPLTSGAGDRDRADAVHVPAHQSAAVDQQRAASPVMTHRLPAAAAARAVLARAASTEPAICTCEAVAWSTAAPEQPQQPRSYPRSSPPARRAARRALGPPSSGAQVIEGCMKKLKDLNKPFKYIGAPAYLREG